MEFTFLGNALIRVIFSYAPPHSKHAPKFLTLRPTQKESTHSPRQHSFKNLFPLTAERCGGNYNLLYLKLIRKYENDLER